MIGQREWIKSTRSGPDNNCVELRTGFDGVRNSKNPNGSMIAGNVKALLRAIQAGQLDR